MSGVNLGGRFPIVGAHGRVSRAGISQTNRQGNVRRMPAPRAVRANPRANIQSNGANAQPNLASNVNQRSNFVANRADLPLNESGQGQARSPFRRNLVSALARYIRPAANPSGAANAPAAQAQPQAARAAPPNIAQEQNQAAPKAPKPERPPPPTAESIKAARDAASAAKRRSFKLPPLRTEQNAGNARRAIRRPSQPPPPVPQANPNAGPARAPLKPKRQAPPVPQPNAANQNAAPARAPLAPKRPPPPRPQGAQPANEAARGARAKKIVRPNVQPPPPPTAKAEDIAPDTTITSITFDIDSLARDLRNELEEAGLGQEGYVWDEADWDWDEPDERPDQDTGAAPTREFAAPSGYVWDNSDNAYEGDPTPDRTSTLSPEQKEALVNQGSDPSVDQMYQSLVQPTGEELTSESSTDTEEEFDPQSEYNRSLTDKQAAAFDAYNLPLEPNNSGAYDRPLSTDEELIDPNSTDETSTGSYDVTLEEDTNTYGSGAYDDELTTRGGYDVQSSQEMTFDEKVEDFFEQENQEIDSEANTSAKAKRGGYVPDPFYAPADSDTETESEEELSRYFPPQASRPLTPPLSAPSSSPDQAPSNTPTSLPPPPRFTPPIAFELLDTIERASNRSSDVEDLDDDEEGAVGAAQEELEGFGLFDDDYDPWEFDDDDDEDEPPPS